MSQAKMIEREFNVKLSLGSGKHKIHVRGKPDDMKRAIDYIKPQKNIVLMDLYEEKLSDYDSADDTVGLMNKARVRRLMEDVEKQLMQFKMG